MKTRQVEKNTVFTVELTNIPSSGYRWDYKKIDGITLTDQIHRSMSEGELLIDGKTITIFYFRADISGEYLLEINQIRPWEKNTKPINVYQEKIFIE